MNFVYTFTNKIRDDYKMRITLAFEAKTKNKDEQAELLLPETIVRTCQNLTELKHTVTPVEISGRIDEVIKRLINSKPDVIIKIKPTKEENANNSRF